MKHKRTEQSTHRQMHRNVEPRMLFCKKATKNVEIIPFTFSNSLTKYWCYIVLIY